MYRERVYRALVGAALACCLGTPGCSTTSELRWDIDAQGSDVRAVRLEVLRGDCESATEVLHTQDLRAGGAGSTTAGDAVTLAPGAYCLRARGVDASCELVAWARRDVTLPSSQAVVLALGTESAQSVPPICASRPCADPICEAPPPMDAGLDAPATPSDARNDVSFDATGCAHGGATLSIEAPVGVRPYSGEYTGSRESPPPVTFVWRSVASATCYELQHTALCPTGALADCDFAAAATETLTPPGSSETVSLDLEGLAPGRHVWRVRACSASGCGPVGAPRYVHIGRSRSDLDGDGRPDLVVAEADGDNALRAVVRYRTSPPTDLNLTLPPETGGLGLGQIAVCDFDADGRQDIVLGAPRRDVGGRAEAGRSLLYLRAAGATFGVANGLGEGAAGALMGSSVACGDVDNDGFADVIVGGPGAPGRVEIHFGAAGGPPYASAVLRRTRGADTSEFGFSVATGDVDTTGVVGMGVPRPPDGIVDVFVGAPGDERVYGYPGAQGRVAFVTEPASSPPSVAPFLDDQLREETEPRFGESLLLADLDRGLGADVVVGAPGAGNSVFVTSPPSRSVHREIASGLGAGTSFPTRFGIGLVAVSRAGTPPTRDLLIGAPGVDSAMGAMPALTDVGAVVVVRGSASGPTTLGALSRGDTTLGFFGLSVGADVEGSLGGVWMVAAEPASGIVWGLDPEGARVAPVLMRPSGSLVMAIAFGDR